MAGRSDVRRWMASRREAETRELDEESKAAVSPREALDRAMALVSFAAARHGWPLPKDPAEIEEDLRIYERWALLRGRAAERSKR